MYAAPRRVGVTLPPWSFMRPVCLTLLALALTACSESRSRGPAGTDSATTSATADSAALPTPPDTPAAAAGATPLEGTHWRLVDVGGQPSPAAADTLRQPGFTLYARGQRLVGSAGCNRMKGPYQLEGTKLKVGPLATTRMACPAMATETAFLEALAATTRYELSGASLTLFGGDTAVARLEASIK